MAGKKKKTEKRAAPQGPVAPSASSRRWREASVILLALLAVLMTVGFFAPNAAVLKAVNGAVAWLIGPGLYVVPAALLVVAGHLLLRLNRKLRPFWVAAVSSVPVLTGALAHLFLAGEPVSAAELGAEGMLLHSGGILAGGFTQLLIRAFSKVGAGILLFLLALLVVLAILRIPLSKLMNKASDEMERTGTRAAEKHSARQAERAERRRLQREQDDAARAAEAEAAAAALAREEEELRRRSELRQRTDARTRRIDFPLDEASAAAETPPAAVGDDLFRTPPEVARRTEPGRPAPAEASAPVPVTAKAPAPAAAAVSAAAAAVPAARVPSRETASAAYTPRPTPAGEGKVKADDVPPWEEPAGDGGEEYRYIDPDTGEILLPGDPAGDPPVEYTGYDAGPDALTPDPDNPGTDARRARPTMTAQELEDAVSAAAAAAGEHSAESYVFPPIDLLKSAPPPSRDVTDAETRMNQEKLIATLASFGVEASIVGVTRGPAVTRYEIQLGSGIKIARISNLSEDIALAMGAQSVRVSDIPEKFAVGVEVPNRNVETVYLRDVLESPEFTGAASGATFALGKDISGRPVVSDISRLPHVLVGGTTNSGKSVCINSLLISLIYKSSPDDLRLILIDPKMVEFASYNGIPHLLIPVVTDFKKAAGALQWAVMEMENRYRVFNENGFRNFAEYNEGVAARRPDAADEGGPRLEKLPRIIIVIDELADLMMTSPKEVETAICRLAQKARAAGMNLVVATQRPSADVIKGTMKANIPSRIAFSVASSLESRIILDRGGAETLLGRGDMLFLPIGATKPRRVQGCFVSSPEIESVVAFIKHGAEATYDEDIIRQIERVADGGGASEDGGGDGDEDRDELFDEAVSICIGLNQCSATMLQRRLKIGFARASRIVDQMEACGIVGSSEGAKPRALLISREDWNEMQYRKSFNE